MATDFDRAEVLRGLSLLYPPDFGIIELDVLKKSGALLSGRFDNREKLVDEVLKYDAQDDTVAIYTALNRIKSEAFSRPEHPLKVANKVSGGLRIDGADVSRVVGILFDIDPFRANGDKKDSTTETEHAAAIEAADWLKHHLSLMGWPAPVMGSSGNGATLRYLTDLPAEEETENLIAKMLKAANSLLPDHLKAQVEVDGAMFDRPRISKVLGTTTRKGPGTPERPHRRARLISAPETLEPVQIDSIMKLVNAGRRRDATEGETPLAISTKSMDRVKPLSEAESDSNIKPCLKEIILNKDIKRFEEVAAHEHKGRVAIATELLVAGYSDEGLHEFFSRLEDYDGQKTAAQIKQILNKFVEGKGGKTWLCKTLRSTEVIPAARCEGCDWVGHGQDPLIVLKALVKAKPREINKPEVLNALADLKRSDPIEYGIFIDELDISRTAKTAVKETIKELAEAKTGDEKTEDPKPDTPEDIKAKALAISTRGDPLKFLVWQAQLNHLGDVNYQKVLILSGASAASETSQGIQPGGSGEKGSGKSDACAATYHLVPMDRRLDGSLSPMSLFYLQETGRLKAGMVLFSDDVEYEPIIPIFKRATARFQHGITHFTVSGGKNREAIELHVPPRMVWWLTSVEGVANEQAFDRQSPISTDSTPEHKKRVAKEIAERRARKELRLAVDEGVLVAREIFSDIFDNGPFKVLITQAKEAKWRRVADFRGQEQFWDYVDALVVLRWRQRRRDVDGWLIAEDQDLIEAKELITTHKVANYSDLTEAEAKMVVAISDGQKWTQGELVKVLEIAQCTVSARLASIMAKSPIITEEYEQGKKLYSINPNIVVGADYWNRIDLIELGIDNDSEKSYCSQQTALLGCYLYVIGVPIGTIINNSSRIPSSLLVLKEESNNAKERYACNLQSCGKCLGWKDDKTPNYSLSQNGPITPISEGNQQQETPQPTNYGTNNDFSDPNNAIGKLPITPKEKEEHDKTPSSVDDNLIIPDLSGMSTKEIIAAGMKAGLEKAKAKEPIFCAVCGADLTGKGQVEKGDKVYCARPGCGYPPRGKGSAEA